VSLAGILSAYYAKEVVLTDYTAEVKFFKFLNLSDCKVDERECIIE
jgi:hypothetical protein